MMEQDPRRHEPHDAEYTASQEQIAVLFSLSEQLMPMASETLYTDYYRMNENGGIVFREEVEVAANQHFATRRFMDIVGPFYPEDPSLFLSLEFPEYTEDPVLLPDENGDDPKINDLKLARELCIDLVESGRLNPLEISLVSQSVSFLAGFLEGYYRPDRQINLADGRTVNFSTAVSMAISKRNSDYMSVREFEHYNLDSNTTLTLTNYDKTNPYRYSHYPDWVIELFNYNEEVSTVLRAYGDGRITIFDDDDETYTDASEIIPQKILRRLQDSILSAMEVNDLLPEKISTPELSSNQEAFIDSPFNELINLSEAAYSQYLDAEPDSEEERRLESEAQYLLDELSNQFQSRYHVIRRLFSTSDLREQELLITTSASELNNGRLGRNVMQLLIRTPHETGMKEEKLDFLYDSLSLLQLEKNDGTSSRGVFIVGYKLTQSGHEFFCHPLNLTKVIGFSMSNN